MIQFFLKKYEHEKKIRKVFTQLLIIVLIGLWI